MAFTVHDVASIPIFCDWKEVNLPLLPNKF